LIPVKIKIAPQLYLFMGFRLTYYSKPLNMEPSQLPAAGETITINTNFLQSPYTTTISFAVAILLFLLPFAEVKCNGSTLMSNTGIGIATGGKWRTVADAGKGLFGGDTNKSSSSVSQDEKQPPNKYAIAALVLGIIGLIVTFLKFKPKNPVVMAIGIIAAVALIALLIQLKSDVGAKTGKDNELNMDVKIKVAFTIWYFLSLLSFIAAAFFGYKHHKQEEEDAVREYLVKQETAKENSTPSSSEGGISSGG
jgi:heme/copper-type cytochrome/quinol oxidase subunit 4